MIDDTAPTDVCGDRSYRKLHDILHRYSALPEHERRAAEERLSGINRDLFAPRVEERMMWQAMEEWWAKREAATGLRLVYEYVSEEEYAEVEAQHLAKRRLEPITIAPTIMIPGEAAEFPPHIVDQLKQGPKMLLKWENIATGERTPA